ncbi:MAG TPA: hypothetical protein ENH40_05295 [Nitrospirae bacterium]|nr:hypothetical protein [Nitrospirota bacterium]
MKPLKSKAYGSIPPLPKKRIMTMDFDVKNIIEVYLTSQGYDGLYNSDGECGCELGDLFPCDESPINCIPGVKSQCTEECQHEGREGGWHMGKVKI